MLDGLWRYFVSQWRYDPLTFILPCPLGWWSSSTSPEYRPSFPFSSLYLMSFTLIFFFLLDVDRPDLLDLWLDVSLPSSL